MHNTNTLRKDERCPNCAALLNIVLLGAICDYCDWQYQGVAEPIIGSEEDSEHELELVIPTPAPIEVTGRLSAFLLLVSTILLSAWYCHKLWAGDIPYTEYDSLVRVVIGACVGWLLGYAQLLWIQEEQSSKRWFQTWFALLIGFLFTFSDLF